MKNALLLPILFALCAVASSSAQDAAEQKRSALVPSNGLPALAESHAQVFKELAPGPASVVLQKGDKQFTIYGVVGLRAVGSVVEITVTNGEKYSVSPQDIFFITNNAFKI
ncbi:hypothetical protein [Opitutus terrae]|uniref:Uncharacterized protein n=1 Tax=Opitutus terrae (strain DSM 11246 / JCM 15787 / PB90-1) TaxID=452637 RepID=B1ZN86_OPITP|nr:hypothetical protein [Opitutus terrae]ACB73455.1 hypothetical protein Oter_0164 [Opitutus terrae PB90-1]